MILARKLRYVPAETITYLTALDSGNITTFTHTFSAVNLGAVYPGRRIVLVIGHALTGNGASPIISVTIGGVTATQMISQQNSAGNTLELAIYMATVESGTTGDVVITCTVGGINNGGSRVIQVYSLDSLRTRYILGSDISSPFQYTTTGFGDRDIYLGGGRCLSTATETWTNATEQIATTSTGIQRISSAVYQPAVAGSRTITFAPSSTTGAIMASILFSFAS